MKMVRERRIALLISLAGALLSLIPYLIAVQLAPGDTSFNGFLLNPIDGFSYLAKMRQGVQGYGSLILPYAAEPGPRALLYVYYLFLGHISRITTLEPIWVFHVARFLAAWLMFYLAYLLNEQISTHRNVRWFGFGLIVIGSGLGWLGVILGPIDSSDVLIPESVPFLVAYSNAHFPMAAAALICGILAALAKGWRVWKRAIAAGFSGFILGALLPFSFVSLGAILGLWGLLELWYAIRMTPSRGSLKGSLNMGVTLVASSLGALPWLLYDLWLSLRHPVISSWNMQNETPSPSPLVYLLGFAPTILLGLIGYFRGKPLRSAQGRLLVVWVLSGALLLYAPVAFQRRLSLGLAFPLSILAAWGWGSIPMQVERRRVIAIGFLLLFSLTNFLVITAGITGVVAGEPAVLFRSQEIEGYRWIDGNARAGSLVLASERTGNRLPAYADVRVFYGHPFETPNAESQQQLVRRLFQQQNLSIEDLQEMGIDWVFYGLDEKALGQAAWLKALTLRWESGEFAIYEVPPG
jgi:hypothetical protein